MDRPSTPPEISKFRSQVTPGQKVSHYGLASDVVPDITFGRRSEKSLAVSTPKSRNIKVIKGFGCSAS